MNFLKKLRTFTVTSIFTILFIVGRTQVPAAAIDLAFNSGSAQEVSKYFGTSVDITINNSTTTYSRAQAELVLNNFFSKNPVINFDIIHTGNSSGTATVFEIGKLYTKNGTYKLYLSLKPKDGYFIIKDIKLEKT